MTRRSSEMTRCSSKVKWRDDGVEVGKGRGGGEGGARTVVGAVDVRHRCEQAPAAHLLTQVGNGVSGLLFWEQGPFPGCNASLFLLWRVL